MARRFLARFERTHCLSRLVSLREHTRPRSRHQRTVSALPCYGAAYGRTVSCCVDAKEGFLMYRRSLIVGAIASSCFAIRRASAWPLVTRQQQRRENAAPHEQAAPAPTRPGAPTISIEAPDITRPVRSPVNI